MSDKTVLIETSARHLHLSDADLATLFGEGYTLTVKKELSQPGQFACAEKVQVVGPKGALNMSILGPTRKATQIEVSATDARTLGVTSPAPPPASSSVPKVRLISKRGSSLQSATSI